MLPTLSHVQMVCKMMYNLARLRKDKQTFLDWCFHGHAPNGYGCGSAWVPGVYFCLCVCLGMYWMIMAWFPAPSLNSLWTEASNLISLCFYILEKLWRLNKWIHYKCLEQFLVQNKCYRSISYYCYCCNYRGDHGCISSMYLYVASIMFWYTAMCIHVGVCLYLGVDRCLTYA